MTGYDKSPDYGGPPGTKWGGLLFALAIAALGTWKLWGVWAGG